MLGSQALPVDRNAEAHERATLAPAEVQARLARAYLSGDGAEVERLLALVTEAGYVLPPKTDRAA